MPSVDFVHSDGSQYPVDPEKVFSPELIQHMDEMANQRDPIIIQLHGLPPTHTHGAVMFEHEPDCAAGVKWVNETEIKGCDCFAKPVGTLPYLN